MLAGLLTDFKDALMTGCAGTARPSQLQAGGMWIDTSLQNAPTYQWIYKLWTGSADIEVFRINVNSNYGGALTSDSIFEVTQVSADAVGALLELVKQRTTVENGQVLSGDTVAEIRFVGRANNASDTTCGYIKWVATDDQLSGTFGGTFSFFSTPDASSVITEHMRAILGQMETLVPAKVLALRHVTQDIATASTIVQLSAAKVGVEFTGSTPTEVQGINSGHDSQEIVLHNRSTANVTLKHQNGTATANDRMKFPSGADFILTPEATVTLYYCTTDSRWKIRSSVSSSVSRVSQRVTGLINTWTAPTGVSRIIVYGKQRGRGVPSYYASYIDRFGNAYGWGPNSNGDGTTTERSSPVAVAGGFNFKYLSYGKQDSSFNSAQFGITSSGIAYAWGTNFFGKLGEGTINDQSSPQQVLGGVRFSKIITGSGHYCFGIDKDGKAYGWGENNPGVGFNVSLFGVGVTTRAFSSPVAVLGGLKFDEIYSSGLRVLALTQDGVAYGWGEQFQGSLGLPVSVAQDSYSSPIAVLGGLTFKKISMREGDTSEPTCFGLTPDGTLYAWGKNGYGQLGVGDLVTRSSPVAVLGGLTFVDFFQMRMSNYGLTADGTLYAWGRNNNGRLGVGDNTDRSSPVAVLGGLKFKKVFGNQESIFAMQEDGTLYAWGQNNSGYLGVGDNTNRSSPVAVLGNLRFTEVYTASQYVHAIATDGTMYAWGRNDVPFLGTGDLVGRSSPVAVVGPQSFNAAREISVTAIPVVAGETYNVKISSVSMSYFGNTPIGKELEEITIEYEKRGI